MAASSATIRRIADNDVDALFAMMRALAEHEGEIHWLETSPDRLRDTGFGDAAQWAGFIAENENRPLGYATYTQEFHIWTGGALLRLDDIYVDPAARGAGLGEQLMTRVFDEAQRLSAMAVWSVRPENPRAIAFYERLGAQYRETGKCIWRTKKN